MSYLTKTIKVEGTNDFDVASAIAHMSRFPAEKRIERREPYKGHSGALTTVIIYHPEGEANLFEEQNGMGDLMVSDVDGMFKITYGNKVDPSALDPVMIKDVIDAKLPKSMGDTGLESMVADKIEFDD